MSKENKGARPTPWCSIALTGYGIFGTGDWGAHGA